MVTSMLKQLLCICAALLFLTTASAQGAQESTQPMMGVTAASTQPPSAPPSYGLSEQSAVTLAQSVLLTRFGFTQERITELNINTTLWSGENFPVCWLIEFYTGEYRSDNHVISVGIDANTGDLRGCYLNRNGTEVWVEADALDGATIAGGPVPTPTPGSESVILPDARPTPVPSPSAVPATDADARVRRFVEQTFVPLAKADEETPYFSTTERLNMVEKAEKAGIVFTEDWRKEILGKDEPLYKSDVLAALVNSQLTYTGSWPVEVTHWYGDIQVKCGFWLENPYLLPEDGEFTEDQALAYAKQSLEQAKGVTAEWFSACDIRYSFQHFTDAVGGEPTGAGYDNRTWWFTFYPVGQPDTDSFYVFFSGAGDDLRIVTK